MENLTQSRSNEGKNPTPKKGKIQLKENFNNIRRSDNIPMKERSIRLRIYELSIKSLFLFVRLARMPPQSFEENILDIYIFFVYICGIIAHLALSGTFLSFYFFFDYGNLYSVFSSIACVIVVGISFLISFIWKLKRAWNAHIVGFVLDWCFIGFMTFGITNPLESYFFSIIFLLGPNFIVSCNSRGKFLWILSYFILITLNLIYHIILILIKSNDITVNPSKQICIVCFQFICFMVVSAFVFIFSLFDHFKIKSFKKTVENITTAIASLDFKDKSIRDLISTNDNLCTNITLKLKMIVLNVKEYSKFLPRNLIGQEEEESSSKTDHNSSFMTSSSKSSNLSRVSKNSSNAEEVLKNPHSITSSSLIQYGLRKRIGVFLLIDISNFSVFVNNFMIDNQYEKFYGKLLDTVLLIINMNKGVIISIVNDKILCGYNIKNKVVKMEYFAAKTAFEVVTKLKSISKEFKTYEGNFNLITKCSIVSGQFFVGFTGCDSFKTFNYLGKKINLLYTLNYICRKQENQSCILVDGDINERIKFKFDTLYVGNYILKDLKPETESYNVYEVVRSTAKTKGNQEWMYQLSEQLTNVENPYAIHESSIKAYKAKQYDTAVQLMKKFLSFQESPQRHGKYQRKSRYFSCCLLERMINEKDYNVPNVVERYVVT